MTTTITRAFDDPVLAQRAVTALTDAGIPVSDVSLIANNEEGWFDEDSNISSSGAADGAGTGAGVGGVLGAGVGALTGLGLMAIPGLGPVVAAGWLAATAVGAVGGAAIGGAAGGIIGALTSSGVEEHDAHVYAEVVRRGGAIVSLRVPDEAVRRAEEVLARTSTIDTEQRREAYTSTGWTGFDPAAPTYKGEPPRKDDYRPLP